MRKEVDPVVGRNVAVGMGLAIGARVVNCICFDGSLVHPKDVPQSHGIHIDRTREARMLPHVRNCLGLRDKVDAVDQQRDSYTGQLPSIRPVCGLASTPQP